MRWRNPCARQAPVWTIAARMIAGLAVFVAANCLAPAAVAGPPFNTDDPEHVEPGHRTIYGDSDRTDADDARDGTLAGVEVAKPMRPPGAGLDNCGAWRA